MTLVRNRHQPHVDGLFNSHGELKKKTQLHPDFTRPLYQYTSAEIRNKQMDEMYADKVPEYYIP